MTDKTNSTDDLSTSANNPSPKRTIGRFTVKHTLGQGGMGKVVLAWDDEAKRLVAIKTLNPEACEDPEMVKRFEREALAAMALNHVNIGRFHGTEKDENGAPIIVMEYIEGISLEAILKDNVELPFSVLTDYMIQACRGLENAYRRSIIHRDIKPSNLLVTPSGELKVIDFGLAKSMWDNSDLTGSGSVVGTPRYISPEQGMGRNVDHRSDIYSLGATFYELVTHQPPFEGDTPLAVMMKHISTPLMPPYMVNPKIPSDISDIIVKMMAKDPGERYQDYEPLIRDLESAKIHRLSKERRQNEMNQAETIIGDSWSETSLLNSTEHARTPASYLTEGLVEVTFEDDPEEKHGSTFKNIVMVIIGLTVFAIVIMLLMRPVQDNDTGEKQSWLARSVTRMLNENQKKKTGILTSQDIIKEDEAKTVLTAKRMELIVNHIINNNLAGDPTNLPTIRSLRATGDFTVQESQDAWNRDFYISDSSGRGNLISSGRDGIENTEDDFLYSIDGRQKIVPSLLSEEEAKARLANQPK